MLAVVLAAAPPLARPLMTLTAGEAALPWPSHVAAPRTETRGRESARAVSFQWLESASDDVSSA